MSWKNSINQALGSVRISDVAAYVQSTPAVVGSAIDRFYISTRGLNAIGIPSLLSTSPELGPLIFLGLISTTENYLREIFSATLRSCGVAKCAAADHSVKLGSVLWHQGTALELAAFEHLSFAGAEEIKRACRNFLDFSFTQTSPLWGPLDEFDRLCQLRHSVVHANGNLAGKNAVSLALPSVTGRLRVSITYAQLQEAALICTSLITSFNTELFAEVAKRWALKWRELPDWIAANENMLFAELHGLFYSSIDAAESTIQDPMFLEQCRDEVKRTYGLL